jgi:ABC-type uncharacterized transport system substrate-binding protein
VQKDRIGTWEISYLAAVRIGKVRSRIEADEQSEVIVFVAVTDPVAAMFVESLGRPGSNATGFSTG